MIQILYDGPSESFSWLLPISTVPEGDQLGVASDIAFTRLQFATNPQFNLTQTVEGECRTDRPSRGDNAEAAPIRETCEDNPLLAGCDLPDRDINADPISPDDGAETPTTGPTDLDNPPSPASGTPNAGNPGGAAPTDAGADLGPDAGAP